MAIQDADSFDIHLVSSNDGQLGRKQLVRWSDAEEVFNRVVRSFALTMKLECERIDSWTAFKWWRECARIINEFYLEGKKKIESSLLTQSKSPRGPRGQQTRTRYNYGVTPSARHKNPVYRFRQGKLPLPESEWIRRREARYKKNLKGLCPGRKRKDGRPTGTTKEIRTKIPDSVRYQTIKIKLTEAQYRNRTRPDHHGSSSAGPNGQKAGKRKGRYGRPPVKRKWYKVRVLVNRKKYNVTFGTQPCPMGKHAHKPPSKAPETKSKRPSSMNQYNEWIRIRST